MHVREFLRLCKCIHFRFRVCDANFHVYEEGAREGERQGEDKVCVCVCANPPDSRPCSRLLALCMFAACVCLRLLLLFLIFAFRLLLLWLPQIRRRLQKCHETWARHIHLVQW